MKKIRIFYLLFVLLLSSCGGGSSNCNGASALLGSIASSSCNYSNSSPDSSLSSTLSVTGVAATGLAIPSASVSAKCQTGTGSAITAASGAYSLAISGGVLPCMLEVTNPADGTKIHSVATGSGVSAVANLTPLTELVTSRLLGQDATTYFAGLSAANLATKITTAGISAAQADVVSALTGTVDTAAISNFISTPMVAATLASPTSGDPQDKVLDALRTKLNSAQVIQVATLLANGTGVTSVRAAVVNAVASTSTFSVGGVVSGLTGSNAVTLLNNAGNATLVGANGAFTFSTPVAYYGSYAVTVGTQPTGQTCTVSNDSGSSVLANVDNINVTCTSVTVTGINVSVSNNSLTYLGAKQINVIQSLSDGSTRQKNSGYTSVSVTAACTFRDLDLGWTFNGITAATTGTFQDYANERAAFQELSFAASSNQWAGQSTAISALQATAINFLSLSRRMYASTDQYSKDLSLVINALTPQNTAIIATNSCSLGRWNEFIFEVGLSNMGDADAYPIAWTEYQNVLAKAKLGNIEAAWRYYAVATKLNHLAYAGGAGAQVLVANSIVTDTSAIVGYQRAPSSVHVDSQGLATAVMLDNASVTVCQSGYCATTLILVTLQ